MERYERWPFRWWEWVLFVLGFLAMCFVMGGMLTCGYGTMVVFR